MLVLWRKENQRTRKPSEQGENQQQTQPTYDIEPSGIKLVEGERSRHCAAMLPGYPPTFLIFHLLTNIFQHMSRQQLSATTNFLAVKIMSTDRAIFV